jgi:hypothetical protein
MKIYITMTGMSRWAEINSLWAAVRNHEYIPDKIYLFKTDQRSDDAAVITSCFRQLLAEYGKKEILIEEIPISETDFASSAKKMMDVLEKERAGGNEIAIDITPGRRAVMSSALMAAWQHEIEHVFYLYLDDFRRPDNPYPMIPFQFQHFVDLKKEAWR